MYTLREIKKGISQPYYIAREINALYSRRFGLWESYPKGIDIFEEDWDNLIILDACRYDTFVELAELPGELEMRQSKASATPEFIKANFKNKKLHDTVYVAGNGFYLRLKDEIDSEMHLVYDIVDNSDREKVNRLTQCAKDCVDRHPNKRLIVHYIPPHHPFVGPTAEKYLPPYQEQLNDLFGSIQNGDVEISNELLRKAYRENLQRVLPKVQELLTEFPGKTVVTADHGELLGERTSPIPIQSYSHPPKFYTDELINVPWHIHDSGERKSITSDGSKGIDRSYSASNRSVEDKLRDLGYRL